MIAFNILIQLFPITKIKAYKQTQPPLIFPHFIFKIHISKRMEDHGDHYLPPFWQPPPTLTHRHRHRHRRPSPFLNSSLIIILLPSLLLLFTVFIVVPSVSKILPHNNININTNKPEPSLSTAAPPIQKSISVKKGWDLLNIILVVFAILCGIFAKRNDDVPTPPERHNPTQQPSTQHNNNNNNNNIGVLLQRSQSVMTQPQSSWFDDHYSHQSQQQPSNASSSTPEVTPGISRLRRTVSSDPYTKFTGNSQFQFFDDLDIGKFYPKDEPQSHRVKDIPVDNDVILKTTSEESPSPTISPPQTPPRNPPAPPPPPPPPPPVKQRRTFQTVPRRERPTPAPAQSSSPPPAPPPPPRGSREEKRRNARKRTTKDIATAIVSLYNHGKRKRRTKSSRNQEHRFPPPEIQSQSIPPPSPPPPPPPPPPVFHNWFKKGSKTKKVNSHSSTPTPTQPPAAPKPPLPKRRARESVPLKNVIPPAPPPPPFKVAEMRFAVVGGGYVNVKVHNSAESWRSGSPERTTCPSPDVNLKADTFIARHHDGWKLEKLNSWREKVNKGGDGATLERWGPK